MKNIVFILLVPAIVGLASVAADRYARHTDNFQHYYTWTEIEAYLTFLVKKYPDLVSIENIGTTHEGRNISAVHVGYNQTTNRTKPIIIAESGLLPREWIAYMTNLYMIHMFAEHSDYKNYLYKVEIIFIIIANPDGFVYTFSNDRNWNKNRRPITRNCIGVDIDRNFDFKFKASNPSQCGPYFSGLKAASENETQAIQNLINNNQKRVKLYVSFQSYGETIVLPYNYAKLGYQSENQLLVLGYQVSDAIRAVYDRWYKVGKGADFFPLAFGTSLDYAFGKAKIPEALTIKLPKGGLTGYQVPENQLDHILEETFPGFLLLIDHVAN